MRILSVAAALFLAAGLQAAEHPEHPKGKEHPAGHEHGTKGHEHPEGKKGHEHPEGHEHPVGSKAWKKQVKKEYTAAVESYVKEQSEAKPGFPVKDEKLGKQWDLKLVNIHKNKIVHLGEDRFFACADFKSVEKGAKDKVDLDFYASRSPQGWKIDKVVVHKVNGKPRFTYNEKNEMVPAAD